jgi:hypothetical protein
MRFGRASLAISSGPSLTATNAGDFAADLLQEQQRGQVVLQ